MRALLAPASLLPDNSPGPRPSSPDTLMTLIGHNNDTSVPGPTDRESVRTHPFPDCQSEKRPPFNIQH